jgi:hypothetical protein
MSSYSLAKSYRLIYDAYNLGVVTWESSSIYLVSLIH